MALALHRPTADQLDAFVTAVANVIDYPPEVIEQAGLEDELEVHVYLNNLLYRWQAQYQLAHRYLRYLQSTLSASWFEFHGQYASSLPQVYFDLLLSALYDEGLQPEGVLPPPDDVYYLIGLTPEQVEHIADSIIAGSDRPYLKRAAEYAHERARLAQMSGQILDILQYSPGWGDFEQPLDTDYFLYRFAPRWHAGW